MNYNPNKSFHTKDFSEEFSGENKDVDDADIGSSFPNVVESIDLIHKLSIEMGKQTL